MEKLLKLNEDGWNFTKKSNNLLKEFNEIKNELENLQKLSEFFRKCRKIPEI